MRKQKNKKANKKEEEKIPDLGGGKDLMNP